MNDLQAETSGQDRQEQGSDQQNGQRNGAKQIL